MYFYRTLVVLLFASVALSQLVDPGLPVTNPSVPGWFYGFNDVYNPQFQDLRTTAALPTTADVTIIGGGITGVSIAYHLSLFAPQLKVVLLDARGIASGASGRNLGWMSPNTHKGFRSTVAAVGLAQAKAQIDFEDDVAQSVQTLAAVFGWTEVAEIEKFGKYHIYRDAEEWNNTLLDVAAYKAAGYTDATTITAAECNQYFGITDAKGCTKSSKTYKIRAAAFVWKLLEQTTQLNRLNLNVQTTTPVTAVNKISGAASPLLPNFPPLLQAYRPAQYNVVTSRGTIKTNTVIHATNGWAAHLLKNLQYGGANANFVFPVSQPIIQTQIQLPRQYKEAIEFAPDQYGLGHRASGGYIIAQGWNPFIANDSYSASFDQPFFDDSLNFGKTEFPKKTNLNIAHQWTGIQGFTSTGYPFTGPIGGTGTSKLISNQWIAAGYNGHGNPRAFGVARVIVKEMLYGIVEPGYPTAFQTNLIAGF